MILKHLVYGYWRATRSVSQNDFTSKLTADADRATVVNHRDADAHRRHEPAFDGSQQPDVNAA